MPTTASINPPNSLILISGGGGEVPSRFDDGAVAFTSTMIAVATLNEGDGPTRITLGNRDDGVEGLEEIYSGRLAGLCGQIVVQTCLGEHLLSSEVEQPTLHVRIFANDQSEPDQIVVLYR